MQPWCRSSLFLLIVELLILQLGCTLGQGNVTTTAKDLVVRQQQDVIYKVAVLSIRGTDAARHEFDATFTRYLSLTAGRSLSTPHKTVKFRMVPLPFPQLYDVVENKTVDFLYVNPSAFACVETEYTARSLVSQISSRRVGGRTYNLDHFGGVIVVRADRDDLQTVHDLKDQVIAAASFSGLGSGQMQFREMIAAGMNYRNDPAQLVFTRNQGAVVLGVLRGEFDVGFVRTDQMERTQDPSTGQLVNVSEFKVLNVQQNLTFGSNRTLFPFTSSTPLYPEWNVAALQHVPDNVARSLQTELLVLADHGEAGKDWVQRKCTKMLNETSTSICEEEQLLLQQLDSISGNESDHQHQVELVAYLAQRRGKVAAWRTTLSYMQLRSMQDLTGYNRFDQQQKKWRCVRSDELYDAFPCPAGYRSASSLEKSCANVGISCAEGYQCLCQPCVRVRTCVGGTLWVGKCVPYKWLLPGIVLLLCFICVAIVMHHAANRRKEADSVWEIHLADLKFGEQPRVLGNGMFGNVVLAEYRGTSVVVKRGLPSRTKKRRNGGRNGVTAFEGDESRHISTAFGPEVLEESQIVGDLWSQAVQLTTNAKWKPFRRLRGDFVREIRQLTKLRHPCISPCLGAVVSKVDEPLLVSEYMLNGSLYDFMQKQDEDLLDGELTWHQQCLSFLRDISSGLRFLHATNPTVIHGDLKSKNVLIDANLRAKVSDFGFSAKQRVFGPWGTPFWMAPELLTGDCRINTTASDVYAFGILMQEVCSRQDPYSGENSKSTIDQVCDSNIQKRPSIPDDTPEMLAQTMESCWAHDPTDRPTAEQIDLGLRVEGIVNERTSRLEILNRDLEQANAHIAAASARQLEHFAAMSHEIRTPLNCILGISSLMEDSALSAQNKESVRMIVSSGHLLRYIVNDVLDYSSLESGNTETDIRSANLFEIVNDTVLSMSSSTYARRGGVKIRTVYVGFPCEFLDTDSRRLQQILYNLLSNAVKFSNPEGIVVLKVAMSHDNRFLTLTVTDNGKGIHQDEFNRIFQPFAQTIAGVRNVAGGTGLGLSITDKLVKALGGSISVDSEVGVWTTFTVQLPLINPVYAPEAVCQALREHTFVGVFEEVSNLEQARNIFQHMGLPYQLFSNMKQFESWFANQNSNKSTMKTASIVCLSSVALVGKDDEIWNRIQTTSSGAIPLLEFGDCHDALVSSPGRNEAALKRFSPLREVCPVLLIRDIHEILQAGTCYLETTGHSSNLTSPTQDETDDERTLSPSVSVGTKDSVTNTADFASLRVLVAEDNLVNQKVLKRLLQRLGVHKVDIVDNGQQAVDRVLNQQTSICEGTMDGKEDGGRYDIVFMDMQMPVMDGLEACRLILSHEKDSQVRESRPPVVFVTAHVSENFRAECLSNGAVGYIAKPCLLQDVRETILKVVYQTMPC